MSTFFNNIFLYNIHHSLLLKKFDQPSKIHKTSIRRVECARGLTQTPWRHSGAVCKVCFFSNFDKNIILSAGAWLYDDYLNVAFTLLYENILQYGGYQSHVASSDTVPNES